MSIQVLDNQNIIELKHILSLQEQETYCKCIKNSLHMPSVHAKFITHDTILYKVV